MTFGEKLQKLRTRAGLSQDQLAELLDVSRQAVSKWERNEAMPEAEKLVRISRQFGVSTDYLLLEELEEPETASTTTAQQAAKGSSVFAHRGLRRFRGAASARMAAITPAAKPSGTGVSSASGNASRMASAAWT